MVIYGILKRYNDFAKRLRNEAPKEMNVHLSERFYTHKIFSSTMPSIMQCSDRKLSFNYTTVR